MSLYRVTGTVTSSDGSEYSPTYWGDLVSCRRVLEAIVDGALDRAEVHHVRIDQGPGSGFVRAVIDFRPVLDGSLSAGRIGGEL